MDSEQSINSFEMKKNRLPGYLLNNFFWQFNNFPVCDMGDLFQIFLCRKVLKFWSNLTFG